MIEITNVKRRKHGERQISGARVYVNSTAGRLVDDFFSENKIYALKFRSSTWTSVKSMATRSDIANLKTIFGEEAEIKWSSTAGCSCGCSPGYVVNGKIPDEYRNCDIWVSILTSVAEISKSLPAYKLKLEGEILKKKI